MSESLATAVRVPPSTLPPWLVGVLYSASGSMNGFVAVALATLLTAHGVSNARESEIAFLILTPSYLSLLLTPLVDCGVSRRAWAMLLALVGAACLGAGVLLVGPAAGSGGHGVSANLLIATLFLGYLATQMYSSTIGGMVSNLTPPSQQSAAGAWLNIAYLGLTGLCGSLAVWEIHHLSLRTAALVVPIPILLSASPLLFTGREGRAPRRVGETMRQLGRDLLSTARQRSYLFAMLAFVVPSATFAMQNLFGGIGRDFGAGDSLTAWVSGVGLALACIVGAALGGPLSNRFDRRLLFIAPAMVAAVVSLVMVALLRAGWRTVPVFIAGVCSYNVMAGINYTATSALIFQIVGRNNPLSSTQYSISTAACNLAIAGAVALDGQGSTLPGRWSGAAGELLVDALLSLVLGTVVLLLVWRFGGGFPRPPQADGDEALAKQAAEQGVAIV